MNYFFGHKTALSILRRNPNIGKLPRSRAVPSACKTPRAAELQEKIAALPAEVKAAIEDYDAVSIVVANSKTRSQARWINSHVWALPERESCFIDLGNGLYCSSPEFCYAQMSRECQNEIALAKLGFELCGSYSLNPFISIGFTSRKPIASTDSIERFLEKCPDKKLGTAQRALRHVANNAASPMECFLALTFGLPARLGGYGLGVPRMNMAVEVPASKNNRVTHDSYHCDLFWPEAKVAVEYNSREFHLSERAVELDTSRVNNLLAAGITTIAVTRFHAKDPQKIDAIAHSIAGHMGKRVRTTYEDIHMRRAALRQRLLAQDPWMPGRN